MCIAKEDHTREAKHRWLSNKISLTYDIILIPGIIIFLYFLLRALGTENFLKFVFELETVRFDYLHLPYLS